MLNRSLNRLPCDCENFADGSFAALAVTQHTADTLAFCRHIPRQSEILCWVELKRQSILQTVTNKYWVRYYSCECETVLIRKVCTFVEVSTRPIDYPRSFCRIWRDKHSDRNVCRGCKSVIATMAWGHSWLALLKEAKKRRGKNKKMGLTNSTNMV